LILVLVLLALVTILVTVTTLMSRVERRSSWNAARIELARQNALFALDTALAQLQREAGPDQRVTARADILSGTANSTTGGAGVSQPYWTGVWKTFNPVVGPQPLDSGTTGAPQLRTWSTNPNGVTGVSGSNYTVDPANPNMVWLVSGAAVTSGTINPATWTPTTGLSGTLAKNLGSSGTGSVVVPLVPVLGTIVSGTTNTSGTSGKYGYWVSDEGIKAKVNLSDPTLNVSPSTSFVQNQLHFMTPQATAIYNSNGASYLTGTSGGPLLGGTNQTDIRSASNLNKVTTLQSVNLINGITGLSGTSAAQFSPDATTYSYGVLADVSRGGLKTDLSALMEDGTGTQFGTFLTSYKTVNDTTGDEKIFSIGSTATSGSGAGATIWGTRWQTLYNYYNLYKNAIPYSPAVSGSSPYKGLNSFSMSTPGTPTPEIHMRTYNYDSFPIPGNSAAQEQGEQYMPRLAGLALTFSLSSEITGTGSDSSHHQYQLRLYAQPELVLYNPYNVVITTPTVGAYTYQWNLDTNIMSRLWSFTVNDPTLGAITVESSKPLTWNGTITNGTNAMGVVTGTSAGSQNLTLITGSSAVMTFKPGELRVFGLGGAQAIGVTPGNQCSIDGSTSPSRPLLSSSFGNSTWAYLLANNTAATGTNTITTPWSAVVSDSSTITVTFPANQGWWSNNGRLKINGITSASDMDWPYSTSGWNSLGRFFCGGPADPGQSITLPAISGIQSTTQGIVTIAAFVLRIKGVNQSQTATSGTQTMPVFASCDGFFSPLASYYDSGCMDEYFGLTQTPNSTLEISTSGSPPELTSVWGAHDMGLNASDLSNVILLDIPRQPLVSLGQFMHMSMRNSMNVGSGGEVEENNCLMSVGGSLCDPLIPLNQAWNRNWGTTSDASTVLVVMDDNFLLNQALFDTYFFSTVPPVNLSDASYSACFPAYVTSGSTPFTSANIAAGAVTLPNARMQFYRKNGIPPIASSSGATNNLQWYNTASANLMLNGAFNVNSTSVPAWEALLSSLSGNSVNYLSSAGFTALPASTLQNPIYRFLSPYSGDAAAGGTASGNTVNTLWGGTHSLSNSQVQSLAQQIVAQVQRRGPFLSMADFLNRRLDGNKSTATGLGFSGALQSAIDSTTINTSNIPLSSGMTTGTECEIFSLAPFAPQTFVPGTLPANTLIGIPGWLMQQDVVQCFSPVMTVRSDTFVVRCYGEADNQRTGATEGRAWCEAVIQRYPDYIDQTDTALSTALSPATNAAGDGTPVYDWAAYNRNLQTGSLNQVVDSLNLEFGRRFKIVSFRWLNESDL
jgi:hypothetical protein